MSKYTRTAVIGVKAGKDKASQNVMIQQAGQMITKCCDNSIQVVDSFISYGGLKDFKKEALKIFEKRAYRYLILYAPSQIAASEKEFREFVVELEEFYGIEVKQLRP
ncbi:MAG: hypothetical protein VB095_13465 [Anaerovorax sp.]|nr:hypothetical protein [Anaerovorax sp.]